VRAAATAALLDVRPLTFRQVAGLTACMPLGADPVGAGRTVDPQERPDGRLSVDFNYAYGPYCQYNDNWVCTLPPIENWLKVPIKAGEKKYPGKESEYPD
jgi:hypothetical protein